MTQPSSMRRTVVLSAVMCGTAGVAVALTPKPRPLEGGAKRLPDLIPQQFGDWEQARLSEGVVSPDLASAIEGLYSETLARTYVRADGARIMLSLAYGENQSKESQIHKPEVCYAAQGFAVRHLEKEAVTTDQLMLPVMRLEAQIGSRNEPITYWIRSGKYLVRGWAEQNLARLRQGLAGVIPDGLLVRVSSISRDRHEAYRLHDQFIRDMLSAVAADRRSMLLGEPL